MSKTRGGMVIRNSAHNTALAVTEDAEIAPAALVPRYLSCIRYRDILVLQGSPLLGAAFSIGAVSADRLAALLVFAVASVLLVAHIFVFNDWAGVDADLKDDNKVAGVFATKGISRSTMRWSWITPLVVSLALFSILGARLLVMAIAIAAVSFLYSQPRSPAKGMPVLSSILHVSGGIVHFLLGYSLFSAIDERGLAVALFFGLTFAAGHLNQEARDFDGDARNGIKTNAVTFGRTPTFIAGLVVFTLAYGHLVVLATTATIPRYLAGLGILYLPHLYWSWNVIDEGLSFDNIGQLQSRYRAIYAVIGAAMLAALLIH